MGEKRRLVVPSRLGYADEGSPQAGIPGGATLVFDVELVLLNGQRSAPSKVTCFRQNASLAWLSWAWRDGNIKQTEFFHMRSCQLRSFCQVWDSF